MDDIIEVISFTVLPLPLTMTSEAVEVSTLSTPAGIIIDTTQPVVEVYHD